MPAPIRLFIRSLGQFAIGLGPAVLMAFLCLAIQAALWMVAIDAWDAIFPPEPFHPERLLELDDWRDHTRDVFIDTASISVFFFFHALVALILTAWLLRRPVGLNRAAFGRAVRGAGVLTAAVAAVLAPLTLLSVTRDVSFDLEVVLVALWFGGTALVLPARLMGYEPVAAPGLPRTTMVTALALLPWFFASEVVGAPLRNCHDCWGMMDGGIVTIPLVGAYLLGLTVSSAAVSAAACMPARPWQPAVRSGAGAEAGGRGGSTGEPRYRQ